MLNAMPLSANFWDENLNIIDCNQAAVTMFGLNNKQDYIDNYFNLTPEFQPDGSRSTEKMKFFIDKAYSEGYYQVNWMRQTLAKEPLPVELTLVRVNYKGKKLIAGYCRDLREQKRMIDDIEKRDRLLKITNDLAAVMLSVTDEKNFEETLISGMELIGQCLNADCVQIWPNEMRDGKLCFVLRHKWLSDAGKAAPDVPIGTPVPYSKRWIELFNRGENVNGPISKLPQEDQDLLGPLGLKSTITLPLFYQGLFWGVFCVDDCIKERYFTENEIDMLRSATLMLVNAINRNMQALKINEAAEQLNIQLTKLDIVLKASKIGLWEMEVKKDDPINPDNYCAWSDDFRTMLGYDSDRDFPNSLRSWIKCLHPDDRDEILGAFKKHMQDAEGRTPYDTEYRMFKKNGEIAYYRDTGETFRTTDGKPIRAVGALMNITETKNLLLETENQRQAAEDANRAKTTFLSTMSHEIRTPMNAILGITEILLQKDNLAKDVRESLDKVYASGDLLLSIINDILDLSKIEAGKLELLIDKYEIASLISDTVQLNLMRIGSKKIEFELHVDENVPVSIMGDELRVKQILNNLLSNAFKYTDSGTVKMTVTAEPCDKPDESIVLVISVSDTGQGMTKEQIAAVFDEYSRFNQEANRTTEGTGLGMSITQNLIHLMKGNITVDSEPGVGSTFTIHLPQGKTGDGALGRELAENLNQFRSSSRAQMKRVQINRDHMPYGSVLIVDDVETNIFVASGLMVPYGLQIDSAESGYAAIEKIKNGKVYDIIFMDHMMPKMDGIEATKVLRSMGYNQPIVALTANAVAGQASIFLGNGFNDFISKPIDVRQLNMVLNKLIRDKQPPEVLEAAKRQAQSRTLQSGENSSKMNPRLMEIFIRDTHKALATLDEICRKNDYSSEEVLRTYIINVHGVKGTLATIGKMDLSAIALKLEVAGREGKLDIIKSETASFLESLRTYIEELESRNETPAAAAAAGGEVKEDKPYLKKMLEAVKSSCGNFDKKSAEKTLTEAGKTAWSAATQKLLGVISDKLLHSDFDEVEEIINEYIKTN